MKFKALIFTFFLSMKGIIPSQEIINDSNMTFEESIKGTKAPQEVIDNLALINVSYYSTDKKLHRGQLVVAKDVQADVEQVFELILKEKFVVNKCVPIVKYNWSDDASMADNNSSAFCYRTIAGTDRLSNHALGRAVDINPMFNPVIETDKVTPAGGKYQTSHPGTLHENSPINIKFKELGWSWGGDFKSYKDYHHFDKRK